MLHCSNGRINELRCIFWSIFMHVEKKLEHFNVRAWNRVQSWLLLYWAQPCGRTPQLIFFWIPPLCSHNYTFSEMARVPDLPYDVQASEKVIFGPTRSNLGCNWDLSTLFLEVSLPHIVELGSLTSDMVSKYAWKLPFVLRSTNFNYFFYLVVVPAHNGYEVVI
jgi:hypothetical protein